MRSSDYPKIALIFPPLWETDVPYLSIPLLKGYLDNKGIMCNSYDLNLDFWESLIEESFLQRFHRWLKSVEQKQIELYETQIKVITLSRMSYSDLKTGFIDDIDFRNSNREILLYFWSKVIKSNRILENNIKSNSILSYHDQFFNKGSFSEHSQYASDIMKFIENTSSNPYWQFMIDIDQRYDISTYPTVGVSIVGLNQVIPAFTLAKYLKSINNNIKIVFGGAWVTQLERKIERNSELFKYTDFYVVGEGEEALSRLLQNVDPDKWNNVIFHEFGRVIKKAGNFLPVEINAIPIPVFKKSDLKRYDYFGTLPLQSTRGCSWGRCSFCSYIKIDPIFREKTKSELKKNIIGLIDKYSVNSISFVDCELSPDRIQIINEIIEENDLSFTWGGFARFEKDFSSELLIKAHKNGLTLLIWGLESGSQKVINLLKKGTTTRIIEENLKSVHDAGIHNRVCLMHHVPEETVDDFNESMNFLNKNKNYIDSFGYSRFTLEYNSNMFEAYKNLIKHKPEREDELFLGYELIVTEELNIDRLKQLYIEITNKTMDVSHEKSQ